MEQISAYHLADNPKLFEPQRSNNFDFIVTDIDNIIRSDARDTDTNKTIPNAQNILHFGVVSSSLPMFTQEVITVNYGNSVMKAAGKPTFSDGTLVVNDYIGADTKSVLMAWQNLSYNVRTDKVGRMADYKKNCYLQEYTPDWQLIRT